MSSHCNPSVVEDGLVFLYDVDDIQSYKGEPTTNVVANPLPTTGWSVSQAQGSALTRTYLTEDGIPFMRFSGVTNGNDYPRIANSVFANSATITGTFSTSLEVKGTAGAVLRLRIYENGSTKITNSITLTSEWTRYTFDNQSTGFNLNQPYFNPATSDAIYDIRNIQVEAKSHSTPFVNGTRSATQGLIDRTGNSTIDISNASFDSNAQMTFDGTDDQLIVNNIGIDNYSEAFSYECVFKAEGTWANDRISNIVGIVGSYAGHYGLGKSGTNTINFVVRDANYNSISSTVSDTSTYHHLVGVWDQSNSQIRLYIDGELKSSGTVTKTGTPDSNDLRIGGRAAFGGSNGSYYHGDIPIVKYYKTALTTADVLQNFKATKSRFNL